MDLLPVHNEYCMPTERTASFGKYLQNPEYKHPQFTPIIISFKKNPGNESSTELYAVINSKDYQHY